MNHREPLPAPGGVGRALHCAALLLLPALIAAPAGSEPCFALDSLALSPPSYLAVLGAPSLRFQETLPPLGPAPGHSPASPPRPAVLPGLHEAAPALVVTATVSDLAPPLLPVAPPRPGPAAVAPPPSSPPAAPPPPSPLILSDDMRPNTKPEDFLPFFQLPGAAPQSGDSATTAPPPGKLPPSSATYTQK